ncbi:hypothetical protein L914_04589 [Phytophthora nicotianae]|uniref:WW domain-containing protein n=1 Tax=Phytophthora nicotianae TaxID=4792 RepID=W2NUF8_PHYNI|nr:hypothetical protein L914_04589 [Phytophthora nicotianae]
MANMKPVRSRSGSRENDAFGWQLFHDRQHNLVYYLHSYTGEVRWPRPETVGFVMHGLRPLPAQTGIDTRTDACTVNPDIWSPYYPHVVMLPSGLMQVHPGPSSDTQNAVEMWCGYNRFPLRLPGQHGARMLPPTWEDSHSGSPFLPPYPVAVLGRDDKESKRQAAPKSPLQHINERFQTPEVNLPRSRNPSQNSELERAQGSQDWPVLNPPSTTTQTTDRMQPVYPKGFSASNTEKKEHNRKGYLLRQARKMMRDGGSSSTATPPNSGPATSTKQRTLQP